MEKLTIDRRKWLRGVEVPRRDKREAGEREHKDTKYCSLTYYCVEKFGGDVKEANSKAITDFVARKLPVPSLVRKIVICNDNAFLQESDREQQLIQLFKQLEIELQFSN